MMKEQNNSKNDLQNISFDSIYPERNSIQLSNYAEKLLHKDKELNFCDRICLWLCFCSSFGIDEVSNDNIKWCICC